MNLFNWLSFMGVIFTALMVVIRFAFYSSRQGTHVVSLWGAFLFLALGVFDLTSSLVNEEAIPVGQMVVFVGIAMGLMWRYFVGKGKVGAVQAAAVQEVQA